ncbi:MAG: hypothetical protein ABIO94_08970 [Opitutaceae bacterium]
MTRLVVVKSLSALVMVPVVLTACSSVGPRKSAKEEEWGGPTWHLKPLVTQIAMPDLVAPAATVFNVAEFLDSEAFFPPNATRTFDAGDPPVLKGEEKLYTQFPNEEPWLSPDQKWQWHFFTEGESTMRPLEKVLRLERVGGEYEREFIFVGPTIGVLWAGESRFSAITSWETESARRIDVVDVARQPTLRILLQPSVLGKFFYYDELDGFWSFKARAWKNGSVLIVRAYKVVTSPQDKLCVAEFSVDVAIARRDEAFRLLRAFIREP